VSDRPFVPPSRVSARTAGTRDEGTKGRGDGATARAGLGGRLAPWADPVTDALGWQVTTPSHRLAALIAETVSAGTIAAHDKGEWRVNIPQAALAVTVTNADTVELICKLSICQNSELFILPFAPWPAAVVLKCLVPALPSGGTLSVRDIRVTTRMGRIVRYLVPEFIPP
jgi:hypothetical protein